MSAPPPGITMNSKTAQGFLRCFFGPLSLDYRLGQFGVIFAFVVLVR